MSQIADNSGALSLAEVADLYIESLHEDLEGRAYHSDSAPKNNVTAEVQPPRVGDLWLTYGTSENPPVLIAISWVGDRFCRAVFVLEEPELAAEDDLLVSAEQCSLGAPLALCAWRDLPVSKGDLRQLVGVLPDDIIEPLAMMLQHRLTGGFRRRVLGSNRLSSGEGGVRWLIEPAGESGHAVEFLSGAPVLTEIDPRVRVRQEIVTFTTHLEERALMATDATTEVVSNSAVATDNWVSRLLRWIDEQSVPRPWIIDQLGALKRLVDIPQGQFQLVRELGAVLGEATREYELDLSERIPEFGGASDFGSFKLVVQTGDQPKAWAIFVPRTPPGTFSDRLIEVEIQLLGQRITLRPPNTKSRPVRINALADPSSFVGQLNVVFREVPPAVGDGDDDD